MMGIGQDKEEVLTTEIISKQIKESKRNDMDEVGKRKKNKKCAVSDGNTVNKTVHEDENDGNARKENERKKKKERKLTVGEKNKEEKQDNFGDEDNEKDINHDKKKRKLADDESENKGDDSPVKKKSKKQKRENGDISENIEKKKKQKKTDESDTENPELKTDENDIGEMREENARKKKKKKKKSKKEKKEDGDTGKENLIENFEKKKTKESNSENPRSKTEENDTLEITEENVRKKKDKKTDESNSEDLRLTTDENSIGETSQKNVGKKKKGKKTDQTVLEDPKLKTHEDDSEEGNRENVRKKKKKEKKTDESHSEKPKFQTDEKDESNFENRKLKTDENDSRVMNKDNVGKKKRKKEKKTDEGDSENPKLKTDENVKKKKKKEKKTDEKDSENPKSKPKKPKKVSFSSTVEVFPFEEEEEKKESDDLVRGKRFTPEEDEIVKEAVQNYINSSNLGEEGLEKVLNCKKHPEVKDCWKEIASAIPYRPQSAVYYRAHILYERGEKRKWTQEEYDFLKAAQKKHGSNWRLIADEMGKHRFHVKDTWRRIKHENLLKGNWNQNEYQTLFDLVNLDLQLKVKEEKKSKHGMLRDNICWEAISEKLSTRSNPACCMKWYEQLSSPMVKSGIWADVDDYKLLNGLYGQDACCTEDVNWDELVEGRPGEVCKKRWDQMVMHIGQHRLKTFGQQVDILAKRYCPDLVEARQEWESKPYVD